MAKSYNGWSASPVRADINVVPFVVAGVAFPAGVRGGDVEVVLRYLCEQMHARVEKLRKGWCWGHNFRINRNANNLSCHGSATAVDVNAPAHPNGKKGTWSRRQIKRIRKITEVELEGVVRCGEFFRGTTDGMHFEIVGTPAEVKRVADKLRARKVPKVRKAIAKVRSLTTKRAKPLPHDGRISVENIKPYKRNPDVLEVQRILNRWYPTIDLVEDGDCGPRTMNELGRAAVKLKIRGNILDPKVRTRVLRKLGFKVFP